jgi:hypothetical protein
MVKYKVIIKAGSIFHHHSRRNNMNNLQIDEDIEVELDEGTEVILNGITFRLGIFTNNNLPNIPNFFNNQSVILKKGTKYINTNPNEDSLGFTKTLEVEQRVYFNCGTNILVPENTPMHSFCGNLKFILTSSITGHCN